MRIHGHRIVELPPVEYVRASWSSSLSLGSENHRALKIPPETSPGNFNWTRPWSPRICVFPLLSWQKRFCEILHLWNRPRVFVHRISVSKPFRDVVGLLEIPTNDGWWVIHQRQGKTTRLRWWAGESPMMQWQTKTVFLEATMGFLKWHFDIEWTQPFEIKRPNKKIRGSSTSVGLP